jgi:hypothetical protein
MESDDQNKGTLIKYLYQNGRSIICQMKKGVNKSMNRMIEAGKKLMDSRQVII